MSGECAVAGCVKASRARGMCRMHYMREYRTGGALQRPTVEDRFWAKVQKTPGCWLFTGYVKKDGYGVFFDGVRQLPAHRFAYIFLVGEVPDGLVIDHQCHSLDPTCPGGDTCPHRRCVNPDHLKPVTQRENALLSFVSPSAVNARKVVCIRNHPLAGDNLIVNQEGHRQCRTCARARGLAWLHKQVAK